LLARGEETVVVDNLVTGHAESVHKDAELHRLDIRDTGSLSGIIKARGITEALHFAASSQVGESMIKPLDYFDNNVQGTISLLRAMVGAGAGDGSVVLSSSAAVYGTPSKVPIFEDAPLAPESPYGLSKVMMERVAQWAGRAHGLRHVALRYFNVAGAASDGSIGEDHDPETHLVPIILKVPLGLKAEVTVFGDDYDTPDGTCVRDYVHVEDLVDAHLAALDHLRSGGGSERLNLGSERGFSVLEIIRAAEKVVGQIIPFSIGPRRPGDPDRLVASSERAERVLGWRRRHESIEDVIGSAWAWHQGHPSGF
jgi:UDP-glucose 4-epimerase